MEKNTLTAIVLSALVFFAYQAFFVPPQQHAPMAVNMQNNTAQEATTKNNLATETLPKNNEEPKKAIKNSVDYKVQSTDVDLYYTNVGGDLHKAVFPENKDFPITDVLNVKGLEDVSYTGQKIDNNTISFIYRDKTWQITKRYELKDKGLISVRMEIKNLSEMSILNNFSITTLEIDNSKMEGNSNNREIALYEYSVYVNNKIFRKGNAYKFNDKEYKNESAKIHWIGFRNHYYALIVKPEFETKAYEIKQNTDKDLSIFIQLPEKNLAPGESSVYEFSLFAGPQDPWLMKKYGKNFEKIIAFSGFPIIEWIAQAIYYTIPFFHNIFKSWGMSIILVSVLIYGITYPLTMKSMLSMRKMQEVQPKIAALREKHKNDPQKLNAEMVEIYRREKVNPFGGCLPFLIQMPFFMALYQILWRAQYFQGKGFLWIKDLSEPDRLIILPFNLFFIGNEVNILPVLTGCIMFLQQKISSKNMIVVDEQQATQQKMMMYILPVMMTVMFYKFASSWAIYFLVFYILSTVTQWKIAKMTGQK